nr:hypothetical protein [Gordonia desulfuricans]
MRVLPVLYLTGFVLAAVILAPLATPGHLLYRDAVSTPRSFVTDAALGVGDLAPRAVPQDWFVALASSVVDGGIVVVVILAAALVFAAVGFGRLAFRLVPQGGRTGAVAAAVVSVWNPYVAERLLQGHWSLLVGWATLGWIIVGVADLGSSGLGSSGLGSSGLGSSGLGSSGLGPSPRWVRWVQLAGLLAVAGLTPTGSVLALIVAAVTAAAVAPRLLPGCAVVWLFSASPWLVAAAAGSGSVTSDGTAGARAFGLRSEPGLGPLGTALGSGGIWNADAVPASRTMWWAAVATACLLVVIVVGLVGVWRSRASMAVADRRMLCALGILAAVTVVLVALTATGAGRTVLGAVIDAIPGAGLLRDAQKWLALVTPLFAVGAAGAIAVFRRHVPSGFALAVVGLLVVAPLPDLAWGVGGKVAPVHYPADWQAVAAMVPADRGAVALWPSDTVRRYRFADTVSLDPAARMLAAPVIESGELRVDGVVVDPAAPDAQRVDAVLATGGDPAELARLGVGWVLVERTGSEDIGVPDDLATRAPVFAGDDLVLFQIDGVRTERASSTARAAAWTAHIVWLTLIVAGTGAVLGAALGRYRKNPQRRSIFWRRSIS